MEIDAFIAKWQGSSSSERANKDAFLLELCDVLGVPRPDAATGDTAKDQYVFEREAVLVQPSGKHTLGRMDLYKSGCFVLEAKRGSNVGAKKVGAAKRGTPAWNIAMNDALGQALGYARSLDTPPPFLVVTDIGHCFDLYAAFDGSTQYRPFPNAQTHRLFLSDLAKYRDTLRTIWTAPLSLDPSRHAAKVTREVAAHLAELARKLEAAKHPPETVASHPSGSRSRSRGTADDVGRGSRWPRRARRSRTRR